jgi:hypothetical protein
MAKLQEWDSPSKEKQLLLALQIVAASLRLQNLPEAKVAQMVCFLGFFAPVLFCIFIYFVSRNVDLNSLVNVSNRSTFFIIPLF